MNLRNTGILLIVLVLLGALVYFREIQPGQIEGTPTPSTGSQKPIWSFTPDDARELEIKQGDQSVFLARDDAGVWYIGAVQGTPVDAATVPAAISNFLNMKPTRVFTDVSDLEVYGLTVPTATIRVGLLQKGNETLVIGDKNPQNTAYYALRKGSSTVYLVSSYQIDNLLGWIAKPPAAPPTPTPSPAPETTPSPAAGEPPPTLPPTGSTPKSSP